MKQTLANVLILVASGWITAPAAAQYKWLASDGTTVYSDVPPPQGARSMRDRAVEPSGSAPSATVGVDSAPAAELPYELKALNGKFPVLLYTAPECVPCTAARAHLGGRGIPFTEQSVATSADFEAFKARGFSENGFPAMSVGREKTVGFEAGAYDRLLNAAGYPRTSKLPPNYRQAAAEPMTSPQAQKLSVSVQRETPPGATPAAAAGEESPLELYRRQMQAGAARAGDGGPSMRF